MPNIKEKNIDKHIFNFKNSLSQDLFAVFLHNHGNVLDYAISCLEYVARAKEKKLSDRRDNVLIQDVIKSLLSSKESLRNISTLLYRKRNKRLVNIKEIINNVIDLTRSSADRRGVYIKTNIGTGQLRGNVSDFSMLFYVIVRNAIESYPDIRKRGEKKEIRVTAECSKSECTFRFRDFGVGIDSNVVENIFENGFTTKPHNHGMGLFIAKKITEIYGGDITFQSSLNKGTEFVVKLPMNYESPNEELQNRDA